MDDGVSLESCSILVMLEVEATAIKSVSVLQKWCSERL